MRPSDDPHPERPLPRIGPFEIVRELGHGAMGVVYEARDARVEGRTVAVKVLRGDVADPEFVERFAREAELAASIQHPDIVRIHEVGADGDYRWFSMDLVHGERFDRIVKRSEPGDRDHLRLLVQVARAVHHAHEQGIVHRDLKLGNVIVDEEGRPRLTDFGLARGHWTDRLTESGVQLGTPLYMSPEQVRGSTSRIDRRTDVWALGVMIHRVACGDYPFPGQSVGEIHDRILRYEPRRAGELDRDLRTIVGRALEKRPEERYPTAADVAEDLERALDDRPILARPHSTTEHVRRWLRRHRRVAVASLLAVAGLAGVFGYVHWSRSDTRATVRATFRGRVEEAAGTFRRACARALSAEGSGAVSRIRSALEAHERIPATSPDLSAREAAEVTGPVLSSLADGRRALRLALARALLASGEVEARPEARGLLESEAERVPLRPGDRLRLARLRVRAGDRDGARELLEGVEGGPLALRWLRGTLATREGEDGTADLEAFLEATRGSVATPERSLRRAAALRALGREEEAVAGLEELEADLVAAPDEAPPSARAAGLLAGACRGGRAVAARERGAPGAGRRIRGALADLERALQAPRGSEPALVEALLLEPAVERARLLLATGRVEAARRVLDPGAEGGEPLGRPRAEALRARAGARAGDLPAARRLLADLDPDPLREAGVPAPDAAEVLVVRGILALADGDREVARARWEEALSLRPDHLEAAVRGAWLVGLEPPFAGPVRDPRDGAIAPDVAVLAARVARRAGDDRLLEAWRRRAERAGGGPDAVPPGPDEAPAAWRAHRRMRRRGVVARLLREAVIDGAAARRSRTGGGARARRSRTRLALVEALRPAWATAAAHRARRLLEEGDPEAAGRAAGRALRLDPFEPVARTVRGFLRARAGAPREALRDLEAAAAEGRLEPAATVVRGEALLALDRPDEAAEVLRTLLEAPPAPALPPSPTVSEESAALAGLAEAHRRIGRVEAAAELEAASGSVAARRRRARRELDALYREFSRTQHGADIDEIISFYPRWIRRLDAFVSRHPSSGLALFYRGWARLMVVMGRDPDGRVEPGGWAVDTFHGLALEPVLHEDFMQMRPGPYQEHDLLGPGEVVDDLRRAVRLAAPDPGRAGDPFVHFMRGATDLVAVDGPLDRTEHAPPGIESLGRWLEVRPGSRTALLYRGRLHHLLGEPGRARDDLERSLVGGDHPFGRLWLAYALAAGIPVAEEPRSVAAEACRELEAALDAARGLGRREALAPALEDPALDVLRSVPGYAERVRAILDR